MWTRCFHDGCSLSLASKWSLYVLLCFRFASADGMKSWSDWFDGRPLDGVNNETIDRVQELLDYGCTNIEDVKCRAKTSSTYFTTTTNWQIDNSQRPPCNSSENLCTLKGQIFWNLDITCNDYEISFLCQIAGSTKAESTSDSISVNGGFIAMAAGLSVVVPLICVLVMQLRRAKMEEREREGRRAAISGGENGAVDPPPSYEQVFGGDYSVLPVHSRNSSMDVLIEENETGRRNNGISGSQREAYVVIRGPSGIDGIDGGGGISDNSQVLQGPRLNPAFSDAPVATISGSRVTDLPVSLIVSQTGVPGADVLSSISGQGSSISNSSSQTTSGSSDSHTIQLSSLSLPSSSLVPSTSASTSLSPPPPPPPPAPPRSPPPPFSSWSFRNTSTNRNISTGTSNTSTNRNISAGISNIQETLRRFPGMHISIEDFFASLRDLQDNVNEGPPPSYDEALKILESAALAKERKNIIT